MIEDGAHIFRTQRLSVTGADSSTGPLLQRLRADPAIVPTLFGATAAEADATVPFDWRASETDAALAVWARKTNQLVAGLRLNRGKISYFVDPQYWSKGIGSEAVSAFVDWVWDTQERDSLTAQVMRDNIASRRILEKTGFEFTGYFPVFVQSRLQAPALSYSARRPDWKNPISIPRPAQFGACCAD